MYLYIYICIICLYIYIYIVLGSIILRWHTAVARCILLLKVCFRAKSPWVGLHAHARKQGQLLTSGNTCLLMGGRQSCPRMKAVCLMRSQLCWAHEGSQAQAEWRSKVFLLAQALQDYLKPALQVRFASMYDQMQRSLRSDGLASRQKLRGGQVS